MVLFHAIDLPIVGALVQTWAVSALAMACCLSLMFCNIADSQLCQTIVAKACHELM